ncbi:MAG: trehalose-phosphatase [Cryobacterium sp.]|nr:trehalose-phosphatase [Oligoflexia bacterium]
MKYHSVDACLKKLDTLPGPVLFAFDFDGTLVGFRRGPNQVVLGSGMKRLLERLAKREHLAIITGRSLQNIEHKTSGLKIHLAGSHGFEIKLLDGRTIGDGNEAWQAATEIWVAETKRLMASVDEFRECRLEEKKFSLSLHFRQSKDPVTAQALYTKLMKKIKPTPRIVGGHLVVNLVPKESFDKGDALKALMKTLGCKSAVFAGDDITDEAVFRRNFKNVLSIRIGGSNREIPAQIHFYGRGEMKTFMTSVLARGRRSSLKGS